MTSTQTRIFTDADGSCRGRVFIFDCMLACIFAHDVSKTDAARITKLNVEMFHDESWKVETHLFWSQKIRCQGNKSQNHSGLGLCTLVSAGTF